MAPGFLGFDEQWDVSGRKFIQLFFVLYFYNTLMCLDTVVQKFAVSSYTEVMVQRKVHTFSSAERPYINHGIFFWKPVLTAILTMHFKSLLDCHYSLREKSI